MAAGDGFAPLGPEVRRIREAAAADEPDASELAEGTFPEGIEGRCATIEDVAAAFDEWSRRQDADPDAFGDPNMPGYGDACARYLFDLLDELADDEPVPYVLGDQG